MKLSETKPGDTVLLPVRVIGVGFHAFVEIDEGNGGKTQQMMDVSTEVHPLVVPTEAARPIEVDDIVFVAFEDGKWQVADRYQNQLFLTPYMDIAEALSDHPRTAMLADAEDCYHVSPKGGW